MYIYIYLYIYTYIYRSPSLSSSPSLSLSLTHAYTRSAPHPPRGSEGVRGDGNTMADGDGEFPVKITPATSPKQG